MVVRAQILLLDRARFSPGEIDGVYGDASALRSRHNRENHGLTPTGTIDAEMGRLLDSDAGPLLLTYTITWKGCARGCGWSVAPSSVL